MPQKKKKKKKKHSIYLGTNLTDSVSSLYVCYIIIYFKCIKDYITLYSISGNRELQTVNENKIPVSNKRRCLPGLYEFSTLGRYIYSW